MMRRKYILAFWLCLITVGFQSNANPLELPINPLPGVHYYDQEGKKLLPGMEVKRTGNTPITTVGCKTGKKQLWNLKSGESRVGHCVQEVATRPYETPVPDVKAPVKFWLDAQDKSSFVLNKSKVIEWKDKSGNKYLAKQSVNKQRPSIKTGAINKMPGVAFNPDRKQFLSSDFDYDIRQGGEVFAVVDIPFIKHTSAIIDFDGKSPGNQYYWILASFAYDTKVDFAASISSYLSNGYTKKRAKIYSTNYDPDTSKTELYLNGELKRAAIKDAKLFEGGWVIGANGNKDDFFMKGDIGEILVFDRKLLPDERKRVVSYLSGKWNIK